LILRRTTGTPTRGSESTTPQRHILAFFTKNIS
jgi:hypothetical protein